MYNPVDEFGDQVRQRREERGLTQRKLAEYLGLSYRTVCKRKNIKATQSWKRGYTGKKIWDQHRHLGLSGRCAAKFSTKICYDFFKDKPAAEAERFSSILMNLEELQKRTA